MIIIWRYQRHSKMICHRAKSKRYENRFIYLFDPVYWICRDHCWVEWTPRKPNHFNYKCWYILIWSRQRYVDQHWTEKCSIVPKLSFKLSPTIYQIDLYRMYRNRLRKFYNINIRPCILRIYYTAKNLGLLWGTQATKKK